MTNPLLPVSRVTFPAASALPNATPPQRWPPKLKKSPVLPGWITLRCGRIIPHLRGPRVLFARNLDISG